MNEEAVAVIKVYPVNDSKEVFRWKAEATVGDDNMKLCSFSYDLHTAVLKVVDLVQLALRGKDYEGDKK